MDLKVGCDELEANHDFEPHGPGDERSGRVPERAVGEASLETREPGSEIEPGSFCEPGSRGSRRARKSFPKGLGSRVEQLDLD